MSFLLPSELSRGVETTAILLITGGVDGPGIRIVPVASPSATVAAVAEPSLSSNSSGPGDGPSAGPSAGIRTDTVPRVCPGGISSTPDVSR